MNLKICPRCGSTNVKWVLPQVWSKWECADCKYTGPIIEGNQEFADEIRQNFEESLKEKRD